MDKYSFKDTQDGKEISIKAQEYKFKDRDIIITAIRMYRGARYAGSNIGYNHEGYKENDSKGINYDENNNKTFYAYKNDELLSPSENKNNPAVKEFYGDIRRVLADIMYVLYLSNFYKGKIEEITLFKQHYTDIENVILDNEKIIFEAKSDNNKEVTICLPISLKGQNSKLSPLSIGESSVYLMGDKDENINLNLYETCIVYNPYRACQFERKATIDLFYGTYNDLKGIFYYFRDKIIPKYAIKKNGQGKIECVATDVCKNYYDYSQKIEKKEIDEIDEIKYLIKPNENIDLGENFYKFWKNNINNKEATKKFEQDFIDIVINRMLYPEKKVFSDYVNFEFQGERKENSSNIYRFNLINNNNIIYEAELNTIYENELLNKRDELHTDYCQEFVKLGVVEIKVDNSEIFRIELGANYADWIVEYYNNNDRKFKVEYSVLSKVVDRRKFPKCPKGNGTQSQKSYYDCDIYCLYEIKEYLNENEKAFEKFAKELKNKCTDLQVYNYLVENSMSKVNSSLQEIKKILFPSPYVANDDVVKKVYEAKKIYEENGKMPNFAIMGGPGTGKSTLVDRMAECFKGKNNDKKNVLHKSTSDLKGAYVGHTGPKMYDLLVKAAKNEQIVFIDEAYNLQKDQFGKEALEICLPLLTGDRDDIESAVIGGKNGETRKYNFKKEGKDVPAIWFAGYEHEMRKMLSENPGLYRRMIKISLSSPSVSDLYENFLGKFDDSNLNLKKKLEKCKDDIRNYFAWASSKEHIDYFGNYAGVDEFYKTCKVRIDSKFSDKDVREVVNEIIDEKKSEIRKQYKAILTDLEKIKFEVQSDIDTILEDVKGNKKTVHVLEEIVNMLLNQKQYLQKGINIPKGALLVGPPGTGKTMLARAIAGEIQKRYREAEDKEVRVGFISTIATELDNPKKIEALFSEAGEYDTSVIFIDELDAIGKQRDIPGSTPALLIQLMKEMDGFEERKNIFVMAATNAPEIIDPALKRPGRFDRNIEVTYPDKEGRKDILAYYLKKLTLFKEASEEADKIAEELSEKTIQYVPAELKNLVNEAAILYENSNEEQKNGNKPLHRKNILDDSKFDCFRADILEMLERLNVGELNASKKENDFQIERNKGCSAVAIHEVGHAIVSVLLEMDPFEKITIIARGDALGYVSPSVKNNLRTKKDFLNQIRICLGGRVAEELFYGDNISIGAVQDIQQATKYANNMITLFGMSDLIGPMAIKMNTKSYLGNTDEYICSDSFRYEVDDAIRKIISEQMSITRNMLEGQKTIIEKMAKYVFENETATGEEFQNELKKIRSLL